MLQSLAVDELRVDAPASSPIQADRWSFLDLADAPSQTPVKQPELARRPWYGRLTSGPWPLLGILAVQVWLSLRLVHLDTAFTDEALYLWVGHQDFAWLLHGTQDPPFASYMSGSPVVYPPIGALADSIAGLAGARILSLCFMLIASSLLWLSASRLYGTLAAFFAVALWASLGETLRLGAFATFDPMACMLLALAGYCAIRAGQSDEHGAHWAMSASLALTVANCAKYATALFDPVVVTMVIMVALAHSPSSRKRAARLAAITMSYLVIFLVSLLVIATAGDGYYITGIEATTTGRASAGQSALLVLSAIWPYMKVIAPVTLLGALLCLWFEHNLYRRLLTLLLALTGVLAPLNQIRIHTGTSLDKHEDFAAWFMAMAAGYAISFMARGPILRRLSACMAGLSAIALTLAIGIPFSRSADSSWPNTAAAVGMALPLVSHTNGEILFQNSSVFDYYIGSADGWNTIWKRISGQGSLRLPDGRTVDDAPVGSSGIPGPFVSAIRKGYFAVIVLNKDSSNPFDSKLIPAVMTDPAYHLVGQTSQFYAWRYDPARRTR